MADAYLSMSIASFGPSTIAPPSKQAFVVKPTNDTSDVDGARFVSKYGRFSNKPDLRENNDIFGSTSKQLHHGKNVESKCLVVTDIDGAHARIRNRMLLTKRNIDPLAPTYNLPSYVAAEPMELKFNKDSLNISDIEGTSCKPKKEYSARDVLGVNDIVGAQACWRPRNAQVRLNADAHAIMEVSDISHRTHRYIDHTARSTNSLDPHYVVYGEDIADNKKFTKPRKAKEYINDNHLLQTRDIAGAYQGWEPSGLERREYKVTNVIKDIQGAQADTIKHSIITNRTTHPLNPVYQSLDGYGQELPNPVQPLVPTQLVKNATIRPGVSGVMPAAEEAPPMASTRMSNPPSSRREPATNNEGVFGTKKSARLSPKGSDYEPLQVTSPRSQQNKPPRSSNNNMADMNASILSQRSGGGHGPGQMSARSQYSARSLQYSARGEQLASARSTGNLYPESARSYGDKFLDTSNSIGGGSSGYFPSTGAPPSGGQSGRDKPPMPMLQIKTRASNTPRQSGYGLPSPAEKRAMTERDEEIRSVRML